MIDNYQIEPHRTDIYFLDFPSNPAVSLSVITQRVIHWETISRAETGFHLASPDSQSLVPRLTAHRSPLTYRAITCVKRSSRLFDMEALIYCPYRTVCVHFIRFVLSAIFPLFRCSAGSNVLLFFFLVSWFVKMIDL